MVVFHPGVSPHLLAFTLSLSLSLYCFLLSLSLSLSLSLPQYSSFSLSSPLPPPPPPQVQEVDDIQCTFVRCYTFCPQISVLMSMMIKVVKGQSSVCHSCCIMVLCEPARMFPLKPNNIETTRLSMPLA